MGKKGADTQKAMYTQGERDRGRELPKTQRIHTVRSHKVVHCIGISMSKCQKRTGVANNFVDAQENQFIVLHLALFTPPTANSQHQLHSTI